MRISYFRVKNLQKFLQTAKIIFSEIGLQYIYRYLKNREFYADFRSEGIIKKFTQKKTIHKNCFCKKTTVKVRRKTCFFGCNYFSVHFKKMI